MSGNNDDVYASIVAKQVDDTVMASLILRDEGPSPVHSLGHRWSINLVVAGEFHRIGLVNGDTVQDAAAKFAEAFGPGR